jgi:crotonobetainyl-CoA:carnitine CoA-transferase CaiB-like acyl-CoA transferase
MQLGDTANDQARQFGRPLDGVRVLALEQMQALPFATQLMGRLGAEVIKVEQVGRGDAGRASTPTVTKENGEKVGATFLRNNLGKQSVAIDFQSDRGRQLVLDLSAKVDVVCENLGPGKATRLGVDYETMSADHPELIYLSISGFGNDGLSPYEKWPAYASVAEAMSGIYEYSRRPHQPPVIAPVGGLGDTGTGMFGIIGVLAALRHRDATGLGQHVDVSMFDAMVSLCDLAVNYWSMGQRREPDEEQSLPLILDSFRSADGWFMVQVVREYQFERLANLVGHPEWTEEERFATRQGWRANLEGVIRPAVEQDQGRSGRPAGRQWARRGALQRRRRRGGRPPRRPPQHAGGAGPHRRRGAAGPGGGEPDQDVQGGRGTRDRRTVHGPAHRAGLTRAPGTRRGGDSRTRQVGRGGLSILAHGARRKLTATKRRRSTP